MNSTHIRPATHADAPAIAAIWNPVIRDTLITFNTVEKSTADICAMIDTKAADGHCFLVAEKGAEILGFATYGQFRAGVGYARTMEHSIILAPKARGKGIGRALMAAIENHAHATRAHSIIAGVSAANPRVVAFHKSCGYTQTATLPEVGHKFGQWLDLVLLQKTL
ncbi:MAG: N-acetyltransferase [Rhodobacteraceae bacterium]|nr:N-acetyltransferase [Paracoccaceae bacterium]